MTLTPEMLFRALAAHAAITAPRRGADFFRDYDDALECIRSWALAEDGVDPENLDPALSKALRGQLRPPHDVPVSIDSVVGGRELLARIEGRNVVDFPAGKSDRLP